MKKIDTMRVMAIDYGTKAIGIAITDELQLTVRPLMTIRRGGQRYSQLIERICSLVDEKEVGSLVIGMPLNMDGTSGDAASRVERLISDLRSRLSIPVVPLDERLTSVEADQMLREMGVSERDRRERSDEIAAAIILQNYLDEQARERPVENSPH